MINEKNSILKISYLLKFYRNHMNISQREMAEKLDISSRNYQRLENAEVEPQLSTIAKICQVLKVPIHSLFDYDSNIFKCLKTIGHETENEKIREAFNFSPNLHELSQFIGRLIESDQLTKVFYAQINGLYAILSNELKDHLKLTETYVRIDDLLMTGNCAERWEYVHRHKIENPVGHITLKSPAGIKFFREVHYNVNSNPDTPSSNVILYDITHQVELGNWLSSKSKFYYQD